MSSIVGTTRTAIKAALEAIPALAGKVSEASDPTECWALALSGASRVFVCYAGLREVTTRSIGSSFTEVSTAWDICAVSQSFASPTGAQVDPLKGTDDLVEALRGIRSVYVLPGVTLSLKSEDVRVPSDKPERGGPTMVVCRYESTMMTV